MLCGKAGVVGDAVPSNGAGHCTAFGAGGRKDNATAVGKLGNDGDHGGHLVGHRFMVDTPDAGIAPQASNLNTCAWKTMENEWADWLRKGYRVDYDISV
ncbi:DNA/RNA non-specific endonuclease [Jiella flava]|uniref:DNA/RNA non-specific endonuclease n=1 Tax=Jiella flava TaxID=2816857 RepID=A0A939G2M4_9HYPH|nr:DNA/RNA non-specific endonuclease [Jiella flava]